MSPVVRGVRRRVAVAAGGACERAVVGEDRGELRAGNRARDRITGRREDAGHVPLPEERRNLEAQQLVAVGIRQHELLAVDGPARDLPHRRCEGSLDLVPRRRTGHQRPGQRADLERVPVDGVRPSVLVAAVRAEDVASRERCARNDARLERDAFAGDEDPRRVLELPRVGAVATAARGETEDDERREGDGKPHERERTP